MQLLTYIERYVCARDLSPGYVVQLRVAVRRFIVFLGREPDLGEIAADDLNRWLAAQLDAGIARETVRSKRRCLRSLLAGAVSDGLLAAVPGPIRPIKRRDRVIEGLDHEQMERLIAAAERLPGQLRRLPIPRALWWTTFLRVAWSTGLRLGDVLSLDRAGIMPDGTVTVIQHKTGRAIKRRLPPAARGAGRPERDQQVDPPGQRERGREAAPWGRLEASGPHGPGARRTELPRAADLRRADRAAAGDLGRDEARLG